MDKTESRRSGLLQDLKNDVPSGDFKKRNDEDDDEEEEEEEEEEKIVEKSQNGRFHKRNKRFPKMQGVDNAFVAIEPKSGKEVIWNESILPDKKTERENRFLAVIKKLKRTSHPFLVRFLDAWIKPDTVPRVLVFITERLDEGTLKQYLCNSTRNNKLWKRHIGQLLSVLMHLHNLGVTHGNLTKENIYYQNSGSLKIGPFALAGFLDQKGQSSDVYMLGQIALEIAVWDPSDDSGQFNSTERVQRMLERITLAKQRNFIEACLDENPLKRPQIRALINHPALTEVPTLKLLSAMVIVDAMSSGSLTGEELADSNSFSSLLKDYMRHLEDDTVIIAIVSKEISRSWKDFRSNFTLTTKFLDDVKNGFYPLFIGRQQLTDYTTQQSIMMGGEESPSLGDDQPTGTGFTNLGSQCSNTSAANSMSSSRKHSNCVRNDYHPNGSVQILAGTGSLQGCAECPSEASPSSMADMSIVTPLTAVGASATGNGNTEFFSSSTVQSDVTLISGEALPLQHACNELDEGVVDCGQSALDSDKCLLKGKGSSSVLPRSPPNFESEEALDNDTKSMGDVASLPGFSMADSDSTRPYTTPNDDYSHREMMMPDWSMNGTENNAPVSSGPSLQNNLDQQVSTSDQASDRPDGGAALTGKFEPEVDEEENLIHSDEVSEFSSSGEEAYLGNGSHHVSFAIGGNSNWFGGSGSQLAHSTLQTTLSSSAPGSNKLMQPPKLVYVTAPDKCPTEAALFTHCKYLYIGCGRWQVYLQMWFVEERLKRETTIQVLDHEWHDSEHVADLFQASKCLSPGDRPALVHLLNLARHNFPLVDGELKFPLPPTCKSGNFDAFELYERLVALHLYQQAIELLDLQQQQQLQQPSGMVIGNHHQEEELEHSSQQMSPVPGDVTRRSPPESYYRRESISLMDPAPLFDSPAGAPNAIRAKSLDITSQEVTGVVDKTHMSDCSLDIPAPQGILLDIGSLAPRNAACATCDKHDYLHRQELPAFLLSPCYHCREALAREAKIAPEALLDLYLQNGIPWPAYFQVKYNIPASAHATEQEMIAYDCKWRSRVPCTCLLEYGGRVMPPCVEFPWLYPQQRPENHAPVTLTDDESAGAMMPENVEEICCAKRHTRGAPMTCSHNCSFPYFVARSASSPQQQAMSADENLQDCSTNAEPLTSNYHHPVVLAPGCSSPTAAVPQQQQTA